MKKALFFAMGLFSMTAFAQTGNVGINNSTPGATLHIEVASANKEETTNEGVIIPKLTKERVAKIDNNNLVKGTLVFVEGTIYTGSNTKVSQITSDGFYHYDGNNWVKGVATDKDTTYTGSTSVKLNNGSFQRAELIGDVTAAQDNNNTTLTKIQGKDLDLTNLQANEVLIYDGSKWQGGRRLRNIELDEKFSADKLITLLDEMNCKVMRTDLGIIKYVEDYQDWRYIGLQSKLGVYDDNIKWEYGEGYFDLYEELGGEYQLENNILKAHSGVMHYTPVHYIECISAE